MKKVIFATFFGLLLAGCCSYVKLDTQLPPGTRAEGEKVVAAFYVQNTSYRLLGLIPWCSGENWTQDGVPLADANGWTVNFFHDDVSLDNNIRTLKRACKEVGSNRIADLSHTLEEESLWSFFILKRKTLKTNCLILEKGVGKRE